MRWVAVIGGVALASLSSLSVRAADLPVGPAIKATPGYIPARFLWTGFYIGAAAGYGSGTATFYDPFGVAAPGAPVGTTASPSLKGALVGGYSGINYQIDPVVIGVEGDFIGTFFSNGSVVDAGGNTLQTKVFWTSSVTGRVGVAFDRLLIYGKGGAGFAYHRDTVTGPALVGQETGSTYPVGWTVGGGFEYALTEHWIGRIEYDYFRFPTKAFSLSGAATPPSIFPTVGTGQVGLNLNEIKGGMAYKF